MTITSDTKEKLKKNWGEKADAMNCYAEVKYMDPLSDWACYIFAINPENEDEIACFVYEDKDVEVCDWSLHELHNTFNRDGEYPELDYEYRPIRASQLFKKLSEGT